MLTFVILHYVNTKETINCINTIKNNLNSDDFKIIVVDNNTLDENDFLKIENMVDDLIKLESNMGFAKANNIGVDLARKKYNTDYIAVINNDVYIEDKLFIKKIEDDYKKYNFDLLGTYISSPSNDSFNPFPVLKDKDVVIKKIRKSKKLIKYYNNSFLYFFLNLYLNIKKLFNKQIVTDRNGKKIELCSPLHGCAIIFSKKYFKIFNDAFDNKTFLFYEEEFLYKRIINHKLISVYDPNIRVFHKEGSSTKKDSSLRRKKLFRESEKLKSLEILVKEM